MILRMHPPCARLFPPEKVQSKITHSSARISKITIIVVVRIENWDWRTLSSQLLFVMLALSSNIRMQLLNI